VCSSRRSLIADAWSIVNGVNRYMTEKFAQTLYGVNTFQLAAPADVRGQRAGLRVARVAAAPPHQVQRRGGVTAALTMPVVTAWQSDDNGSVFYGGKRSAGHPARRRVASGIFEIKNLRNRHGTALQPPRKSLGRPVAVLGDGWPSGCSSIATPLGRSDAESVASRIASSAVVEKQGSVLGFRSTAFVVVPAFAPAQNLVNRARRGGRPAREGAVRGRDARGHGGGGGGHAQPPPPASQPGQQLRGSRYVRGRCSASGPESAAILVVVLPGVVIVSLVIGGHRDHETSC